MTLYLNTLILFWLSALHRTKSLPTQVPTFMPSNSPTVTPTPVSAIAHTFSTIALHQIIIIKSSGSELIRLTSFDTSAQKVLDVNKCSVLFLNNSIHTDWLPHQFTSCWWHTAPVVSSLQFLWL